MISSEIGEAEPLLVRQNDHLGSIDSILRYARSTHSSSNPVVKCSRRITTASCPIKFLQQDAFTWTNKQKSTLLKPLFEAYGQVFSDCNLDHMLLLDRIWTVGLHEDSFNELTYKSERWKELGFQGSNPVTDLRGCGVLGLRCIDRLVRTQATIISEWHEKDLLASATCLNIAQAMVFHLQLFKSSWILDPSKDPNVMSEEDARVIQIEAMHGFYSLCSLPRSSSSIEVFAAVVCAGMIILNRLYLSLQKQYAPTLLDFPKLIVTTRVHLLYMLANRPSSVEVLETWAETCTWQMI